MEAVSSNAFKCQHLLEWQWMCIFPGEAGSWEGEMNQDFQMHTAGCPDYQRLLQECQSALVAWKNRSDEIVHFGLQGKTSGDGLQRLQAEYARAYNRLERHAVSCRECSFPAYFTRGGRINLVSGAQSKELLA